MDEVEQLDLKLKLFGGTPIEAKGFGDITPLKVKEIISFGYSGYLSCLNLFNIDKYDLGIDESKIRDVEEELGREMDAIEFLIALDPNSKLLIKSFELFLGGEAVVDKDSLSVRIYYNNDTAIVNYENIEEIREVIKWQNYIKHFKEEESNKLNPADDKVSDMQRKMEELKKEVEKAKGKQEDKKGDSNDLDMFDILSSISSVSKSVNEYDALNFTVYQVYSKFKRLDVIDKYNINIKSILAGAKDVKMSHWSSKLD